MIIFTEGGSTAGASAVWLTRCLVSTRENKKKDKSLFHLAENNKDDKSKPVARTKVPRGGGVRMTLPWHETFTREAETRGTRRDATR